MKCKTVLFLDPLLTIDLAEIVLDNSIERISVNFNQSHPQPHQNVRTAKHPRLDYFTATNSGGHEMQPLHLNTPLNQPEYRIVINFEFIDDFYCDINTGEDNSLVEKYCPLALIVIYSTVLLL